MNTLEVGKKLVEYCQRGENMKAVESLYSPEIVSVEAMSMPNLPAESVGLDAIRKKHEWWDKSMEVHSSEAHGPFALGDRFAVEFKYDTTNRDTKERMTAEEVGVYTVKDGKIVKEEFFMMN